MKSLLIGINAKYIHPCMALYQLKANCSYPTDLIEFTIKDDNTHLKNVLFSKLNQDNYQLVGFSSYLWNVEKVIYLANYIKQIFPTIKILIGGPEVGYDALHFLLNYPNIDYIITGEGEDSFQSLCEYLDDLIPIKGVSNLVYRSNNQIVKNDYKLPDLTKIVLATLDVKDYQNRVIYLESNRGCPYHCSYCVASIEKKVRFFDLVKVKEILLVLMKERVKIIKFLDRTFNTDEDKMIEILDFIDENNIESTFQFELVVERLSKRVIDRISLLKKKWIRLEVGIQSIHEKTNLEVGRKQDFVKLTKNIELLKATNKVDLHIDLIAGLPYEDKELFHESFNETFKLRGKELQLGFLKFLRGTPMMKLIIPHSYIYHDTPPYEIICNKYLSIEDISYLHIVEKGLNKYYNNCSKDGNPRFNYFWNYLFDNKIITDYFYFFYQLGLIENSNQLDSLYETLDNYFITNKYYNIIHYNLLADYLSNSLVKPKKWWCETLTKEERQNLYPTLVTYLNKLGLNIDINFLYQYALVIVIEHLCLIAIYKEFNHHVYFVDLLTK